MIPFNTLNENINEIPDLFIYVFESDDLISYQRLDIKQFYDNDEFFVLKLLPDPFRRNSDYICDAGIMTLSVKLDFGSSSIKNFFRNDSFSNNNVSNNNLNNKNNNFPANQSSLVNNNKTNFNIGYDDDEEQDLTCALNPSNNTISTNINNMNPTNINNMNTTINNNINTLNNNNTNALNINNINDTNIQPMEIPLKKLKANRKELKYVVSFKIYQVI